MEPVRLVYQLYAEYVVRCMSRRLSNTTSAPILALRETSPHAFCPQLYLKAELQA
jgi:hypothetical protein